jgi:hypothetical protein
MTLGDGRPGATFSPRRAAAAWIISASLGWTLTVGMAWLIAQML